jgi:hypothetical protein
MFCYSFFYYALYSLSLRLYSGLFSVIYVLSACITVVACNSFPANTMVLVVFVPCHHVMDSISSHLSRN